MRPLFFAPLALAAACATPAVRRPVPTVAIDTTPPPLLAVARPGDLDDAALAATRLVHTSCGLGAAADRARIESRVAEMRADVDQAYATWKKSADPACRLPPGDPSDTIGESFGSGGLGLSGAGVSRTNVQVSGVDEPDLVKTDGRYVYVAARRSLRVVWAKTGRVLSTTQLEGEPTQLLLEGGRLVVYVALAAGTEVLVYDVTKPSAPDVRHRLLLSGRLVSARRVGSAVHTVVTEGAEPARYETWPPRTSTCGQAVTPAAKARFERLKVDNERAIRAEIPRYPTVLDGVTEQTTCETWSAPGAERGTFTSLISFDLDDDAAKAQSVVVRSKPGVVFASEHALYLAVERAAPHAFFPAAPEITEVHKVRIGAKPTDTAYAGSGVVPGRALSQFSMDESRNVLRFATQTGRSPQPSAETTVSTLLESEAGNLVRIGAIEHLAPGEDIRAVRFDGDRGYLVTFENTDPLFSLDLADPLRPRVVGTLEVPGYSSYLHRVDGDHVLAIGHDVGSRGGDDALLLQLFDVSDPRAAKRMLREAIGGSGTTSPVTESHLAFTWLAERRLFAFPATTCESTNRRPSFHGTLVYELADEGFRRLGTIEHATRDVDCYQFHDEPRRAAQRAVVVNELIYSIGANEMRVQRLDHLGYDVANVAL